MLGELELELGINGCILSMYVCGLTFSRVIEVRQIQDYIRDEAALQETKQEPLRISVDA